MSGWSSNVALRAALLVLSISPVAALIAQDAPIQDVGAPPERGIARISIVTGDVSVKRGDSGDWVAAVVNAPMMAGDRVATGGASRAEVQFDAANLIRIGAHAEIRLAQLENGKYIV